jgi:hypothetical protein
MSYDYRDSGFILFLITVFSIAFLAGSFVFLYRNGRNQHCGDAWKVILYLFAMLSVGWTSAAGFERTSLEEIIAKVEELDIPYKYDPETKHFVRTTPQELPPYRPA